MFRKAGIVAHAPGRIDKTRESERAISFDVQGWRTSPTWVMVSGLRRISHAAVNGQAADLADLGTFNAELGCLALRCVGRAKIEIQQ